MTPYEKSLGQILVALVKRAGGEIIITEDEASVYPHETVYIYNDEGGHRLIYKDHTVIEEV